MLEMLLPIHPKLVHFPIALFMTALGLDALSLVLRRKELHQTSVHLYVLAALITPVVIRTGLWEEERLNIRHPLMEQHQLIALWTMWISLMSLPVLWLAKKEFAKYFRIIFLACLLAVAGIVSYAGHLGGQMVYEYGVGVEK